MNNREIHSLKGKIRELESQLDFYIKQENKFERRFKNVIQNIAEYCYGVRYDVHGKIISTYNTPQCLNITGYTSEEYQENLDLWISMVYPADRKQVSEFFVNLKSKLTSGIIEHRIQHKNGSIRWVSNHCTFQWNDEEQVLKEDGFILDITDQKHGENAYQRLASIVESAEDAILSESLEGIITSWNRGAEKLYGYTQEEIIGQSITILAPVGYEHEAFIILDKIKNGEYIRLFHTMRRSKDGKIIDVSLNVSPIYDNRGNIIGASMIVRDITERKRLDNALRESEQKYRNIVNLTSEGYWMLDHQMNILEVNDSLCKMLGYSKDELLGKNSLDFLDEQNLKIAQEQINKIPSIKERTFDIVLKSKEGMNIFTRFNSTTIQNHTGEHYSFSFITDISELKIAENALRESQDSLQAILLSSPDIILIINQDNIVEELYTGQKSLLWMPGSFIKGKSIQDTLPHEVASQVITGINQISSSSEPVSIEFSIKENGNKRYYSALASRICCDKSKKDGCEKLVSGKAILVIRDVSKQKRTERLREDVERIVRHDMKNPLNGIIGFSQLLMAEPLQEKQKKMLSYVYNNAHEMLHMIDHSLDLFKMEEGTYTLTPYKVNLVDIFQKLNNTFMLLQKDKNITLQYHMDDKILTWVDTYYVYGEYILLENLFANLMKNALEASPENETISVSMRFEDKYYYINIHNSGAIPENIQKRFFERYITTKKSGTGIGTYSAFLIARVHKGNISFISSEKEGTTITVKLPENHNIIR